MGVQGLGLCFRTPIRWGSVRGRIESLDHRTPADEGGQSGLGDFDQSIQRVTSSPAVFSS